MKYPKDQFSHLVKGIQILKEHFENVDELNTSYLYSLLDTNFKPEGKEHNTLVYCVDALPQITRKHAMLKGKQYTPLIKPVEGWETYPNGCNDTHIQTAVRKALKQA